MAVSEENAAGYRVVTAPTNGACGIIPAVLKYALQELIPKQFHGIGSKEVRYCKSPSQQAPRDFLLTAGLVGMIFKHNASISGADMGCQGEVGVVSPLGVLSKLNEIALFFLLIGDVHGSSRALCGYGWQFISN